MWFGCPRSIYPLTIRTWTHAAQRLLECGAYGHLLTRVQFSVPIPDPPRNIRIPIGKKSKAKHAKKSSRHCQKLPKCDSNAPPLGNYGVTMAGRNGIPAFTVFVRNGSLSKSHYREAPSCFEIFSDCFKFLSRWADHAKSTQSQV